MNRAELRKNSTLYLNQTIHMNPQITEEPIQITENHQYIPMSSILDEHYNILEIEQIQKKYNRVCLNWLSHLRLQKTTALLRRNLKHMNNFNNSRKKPATTMQDNYPNFPNISFQHTFLLQAKKGCKDFRNRMNPETFKFHKWNCFKKHQANFGEMEVAEMQQIAATAAHGNCLMKAKDLQYLLIRNQFANNSRLYLMGLVESPNCKICKETKDTNIHHLYEYPAAKSAWEIVITAFNEIGVHIYIDKEMAILNYPEVNANDIRRVVINFVRLEIRNAKLNEYILSENLLIQRLITLAEIFMTQGHQESIWANLFYHLSGLRIKHRVFPRSCTTPLNPD